ncbi:hypothetical protein QTP86_024195 [Hemibagrus guttatus]|nr:hypothetical protein QTP86_024195 [Hemibagrus guttatus]
MSNADASLADELNIFYALFEAASIDANSKANTKANTNAKANASGCRQEENANTENTFIISEHDVRRAFGRVNTKKAAGPDGISGRVLRVCADQLAPVFTEIFNLSLIQCSTWDSSLCQWISNFLTGRPQAVRMGRHVSASVILSTGAPCCVLSPLLYSLYTYDCVATTNSTTTIKFAEYTAVVRLISANNEMAYLEEIRNLENWCQRNNLFLNVSKTKELIVDFSMKQERNYQTP